MAVINIVASFISLYVSTLLLVLFIAYAYLPPRSGVLLRSRLDACTRIN